MIDSVTIVIPAKNEARGLARLLPRIRTLHPDFELIVVDDGSTDDTALVIDSVDGVERISHPVSIGNGGAVKTGARAASGSILLFMDADGQHAPEDIARLLQPFDEGYDLIVGARTRHSQASTLRAIANRSYNALASLMVGFRVLDLTSGFRAVRRDKFLSILYLLPNRFSYPTTSTMAFFRSGYFVKYVPIRAASREGKSHIRLMRDGMRFLVIILKIGALFSPMRLFLPVSVTLFAIATSYYLYTFALAGRFTNMGMLLYMTSLSTFLIGIVSEQVSALHYRDTSRGNRARLTDTSPTDRRGEHEADAMPDGEPVSARVLPIKPVRGPDDTYRASGTDTRRFD